MRRVKSSNGWTIVPVLGPPVIWSVHLLACYLLVTATTVLGKVWLRVEVIIVTLVALALIGLCAAIALDQSESPEEESAGLSDFVRSFGVAASLLFGVAVLFTLVPVLVLQAL